MKKVLLFLLFIILLFFCCKFKKTNKVSSYEHNSYEHNFYEQKTNITTDNEIINSILDKYNMYNFSGEFVYNNLFSNQKEELSNFQYLITKGNKTFTADGNTCKGITFYYPNEIIIIADNQNKWCNTELTMSDKYLIHEMAHALASYESGSRKHSADWASEVELILTRMNLTDKTLLNDIINEYGYNTKA